jgi:hypothetical protein
MNKAFVIFLLITTAILLEIGVRLWGYSEHYIYDPMYTKCEKSADIPYVHKPGLVNARGRGFALVNTDALGLRSKTAGVKYGRKKENEYRIAILGDSIAFGEGVKRAEDTFPQVLEDELNQKQHARQVKVFNYGVSAYSAKEMLATLQYRAFDVEPDLVLMAVIPDDFRAERTVEVDRFGYTFNKSLSGFMAKDSLLKRILREVRLVYLLRDAWHSLMGRNMNGVLLTDMSGSYPDILKFKEMADQHHLSYAVVLLPSLNETFKTLPLKLDEDRIIFMDLSSLKNEFTPLQFMASKFDGHPSAMVHRRIGGLLSEYIMGTVFQLASERAD